MKRLCVVLIVCLLIFVSGCNDNKSKEVSKSESETTIVYITRTGECYHRESCSCLNKSKIEKTLEEVVELYRPCQLCYPPVIEQ